MTKEYTGFSISNFRTGFDEAVEPWLLPRDAVQVLKNAHLYRGVIEKIPGYNLFALMSYRRQRTVSGTGDIDGANKTFTVTLSPRPSTNNITIQATTNAGATQKETFIDNGMGVLMGSSGGFGTVNYTSGAVSVTFGTNAPADLTVGGIQYNAVLITVDSYPTDFLPIMGIKPFIADTGAQDVLIFDTRRVGKIVTLLEDMAVLQQLNYGVSEIPHEEQTLGITTGFNNSMGPFTGTVSIRPTPGSLTFLVFDSGSATATLKDTITDNGSGGLVGATLDPAAQNFINYSTGQWRMTFLANQPAAYQVNFSACFYGDVFTGDFTNFFDVVNFQTKAFITNNIDAIRYYDNMCLKYLNTNLSLKPNTVFPYDITTCLHLALQRERLLLVAPFVNGVPALNSIYWSTAGDPLDFTNDEQLFATTSENIKSLSEINTDLVVRFSNSERVFRYTGDAFSPFRWDPTNVLWRCDASYSAINYDSWFSSVGLPAIVGSDGVNVKRADEIIPDFTLNLRIEDQQPVLSIDQGSIGQCYGERFDEFKEGWLCFRSYDQNSIAGVKASNSVLAFNYLDETYSVYTFPFSCLGYGRIVNADVWGNTFIKWEAANFVWSSYSQTDGALANLGGDQNGSVYEIGVGNDITDMEGNIIPCLFEMVTKDFNPFVEDGQLSRLGYIDFLFSSNASTTLRLQLYKNNELDASFDTYYKEVSIQLTGGKQSKVWKRIYSGAVGRSHTFRLYQVAEDFVDSSDQTVRIHAMVPYFKAAGRIYG